MVAAQMRDRGLDRVPHPGEVGVDDVLPRALVEVGQRAKAEDAGIAAHDVQPSQSRDPVVQGDLDRAEVTDIRLDGDDPAIERLDLLDGLGHVLRCRQLIWHRVDLTAEVKRDDVGALLCQPDRMRASLPSCRARDERDLACHSPGHVTPGLWLRAVVAAGGRGSSGRVATSAPR